MNMIKKTCQLFFFITFFCSSIAFAQLTDQHLFTINITNQLYKHSDELSCILTLPAYEYYCIYQKPMWKRVEDRLMEGKLKSNGTMNLSICGSYDPAKINKLQTGSAHLTIINLSDAAIVWKGEFKYDSASNQVTPVVEIDNKKYYVLLNINGARPEINFWICENYSSR